MTILDELALVKPEIPVTSIRTAEHCCPFIYTILIQIGNTLIPS